MLRNALQSPGDLPSTVKQQVTLDKFRYCLAIAAPHSKYHVTGALSLGPQGHRCSVAKDDFQATWRETEVVSADPVYRTNFGKLHYVQMFVRDHPLIMRPGQAYRLAVSFDPDITLVGATAYVADYSFLTLVDVAAPSNPRLLGSLNVVAFEVAVRDNQAVTRDQLLFRIDPVPFEMALARADAQVFTLLVAALTIEAGLLDEQLVELRLQRPDYFVIDTDPVSHIAHTKRAQRRAPCGTETRRGE